MVEEHDRQDMGVVGLTLGLDKDALVNTGLEGTVEEGVELGVGVGAELVVGLDVLLQALTAASERVMSAVVFSRVIVCLTSSPSRDDFMHAVWGLKHVVDETGK